MWGVCKSHVKMRPTGPVSNVGTVSTAGFRDTVRRRRAHNTDFPEHADTSLNWTELLDLHHSGKELANCTHQWTTNGDTNTQALSTLSLLQVKDER